MCIRDSSNIKIIKTNFLRFEEQGFAYNEKYINSLPTDADIIGYFQSEKYFLEIKDEIKKDFTFKDVMTFPDYDYVSIHVRRGDYVWQPQNHPSCSVDYYAKAKKMFPNSRFVVLSDDIAWCKDQEIFSDCEFWIGDSQIHDMFVMSKAKHNIIANSSFSWWGAWLNDNQDKRVVAPKKWFGTALQLDTKDLLPKEWIVI
jgi:hypothetical protein